MKVRLAVLITSCVFSGASLAAALGDPSLTAGQNIKVENGEVTVPGLGAVTVVRYTWRDSIGDPRSVSLVPAGGTTGYAVQMTYKVVDGVKRTAIINADAAGDGGFGYFVSHELYRNFTDGNYDRISVLYHGGEDDSPFGRYLASTGTASSVGLNQAVHEYRLNYPRWGTVASIPNPDGAVVSSNPDDHQRFLLPVVIRWSFVSGQDYPLWSVDYDLTAAGDHISTDVRGPYGVMIFNESANAGAVPWVTATRWADKYKFVADAGVQDFAVAAAGLTSLPWSWNSPNTGRRYNTLGAGTYEFGLVDTVPYSSSLYADGYSNNLRGFTSASFPAGSCDFGMRSVPCGYEWSYQSFQDDAGPPVRPKLAWGSSPFLGSSLTEVYINSNTTEPLSGKGHIHYGVHIVFGRAGTGTPLTLARAALVESNRALTVSSSPAQGGTVSYSVLGDPTNPHVDAGRTLAPWTSVSFIATPAPGFAFTAWTGGCAGAVGPTCIVTMDAAKTVTATFTGVAVSVRGDVNGDGKADLFWRNNTPGVGLSWWTMNGSTLMDASYYQVGAEWQIADVGDLNGDGKADLIWRRTTDGAAYLWTLNGLTPVGFFDLGILAPSQWTLIGSADFNGDHKSDILWRNVATGSVYMWIMNGGTIASQATVANVDNSWTIVDLADFNGDGKADILWHRNDGNTYIYFMDGLVLNGAAQVTVLDPMVWTLLGAGDFNGDGKADLLWRSNTGEVWIWTMNGAAVTGYAKVADLALAWSLQTIADLDGDGKADLVWRHTDGTVFYWKMNGTAVAMSAPISNPGSTWRIVGP